MQPDAIPPIAPAQAANFQQMRQTLRRLLQPGLIGTYDHVELVELFATPRGGQPLNVLSIVVLGEGKPNTEEVGEPILLTPKRIHIDGFKNWSFGVARSFRPVSALDGTLADFCETATWALSGKPLPVGPLQPQPPMFAPPDGTVSVPLNRLLKNNFWAGSHVFRLMDKEKTPFRPFFEDRRRLQSLSDAVSPCVPLALAGMADFLGDILIQLPVTVLVSDVRSARNSKDAVVSVTWHPAATPRPLQIAARTRWDDLLTGADVSGPFENTTHLAVNGHLQPVETELWDNDADLLLSATAPTSTLKRVNIDLNIIRHEPRLFTALDAAGSPVAARVTLISTSRSVVGDEPTTDANYWRGRRQELEEARRLAETRDFVQYRPKAGSRDERERALADLRYLIDTHGGGGVDLWDPYLTADDLLQTLFWCRHANVRLRGLTDGRDPPSPAAPADPSGTESETPKPSFPDRQRATLARDAGNREGLRLEYRTRRGPEGWAFHDRFLIFPGGADGPLAWSLGTSVSSLGVAHHILQRLSNAALVAGAFKDLWSALCKPQHLIWRSW